MPGKEDNIGVAIKKGRIDGGATVGYFHCASESENKVVAGNCTIFRNAIVKFFSRK
jgi:hypothetical protein